MWVFDGNGFTMVFLAACIPWVALCVGAFRNHDATWAVDATVSNGSNHPTKKENARGERAFSVVDLGVVGVV